MRNKYFGTKKVEFGGIVFDSTPECHRYQILREAEKRGLISGLELQKVFTLLPKQTEAVEVKLKTKTKIIQAFREHPVTYAADFVYIKNGKEIVEDSKSTTFLPEDYILKRKMMRYFGHPITEVFDPTEGYPEIARELGIKSKEKKKKSKKKSPKKDDSGLFD